MQVFVSHSQRDRYFATRLMKALQSAGIQVWNPYESLYPGDNWSLAAGKALEQSDVMVVIVTPLTEHERNVAQEVQYALTTGNYHGRLVPVVVDQTTFSPSDGVPWILGRFDPIFVRSDADDLQMVIDRVMNIEEPRSYASA